MITLQGVGVAVAGTPLLRGIDLQLSEQRIAVIGANGSGKSTFARLINGLLVPSTGDVMVDVCNTRDQGGAVRRAVGFVFQNPDNQIVFPTVGEDLAFGLKNIGLDKATITRRIADILHSYGLAGFQQRLIHQLSGGEKQLIAIAGVLVMEPCVVVLDEPTTLLDLGNTQRIGKVIDALQQQVILVTHDLESIAHFDRAICFHRGQVIADGEPTTVIADYRRRFNA